MTKQTGVVTCAFCEKELEETEVIVFDGEIMCADCRDTETVVCDCCSERIWSEDAEIHDGIRLCTDCYDEHYTHCDSCGALIHNDDANYEEFGSTPYCNSCYDSMETDHVIQEYSYKPEPIFYGSGDLYLGAELEIDKGGQCDEHAETLLDIANARDERLYCKYDGSLNNGFEMVSHPMTLEEHEREMPWRDILAKAASMGYRSHQTLTCGLHVHVNRDFFGKTWDEQEAAIARVVYFVENHWNELLKLSRRTEASISRWASRYGIAENTKETYKNAKDKHLGRYVAVNLENDATIEFRMFRGTLRYETFLATLQLVELICHTCKKLDDTKLERLTWNRFVRQTKKKELLEYLKSKQLWKEGK